MPRHGSNSVRKEPRGVWTCVSLQCTSTSRGQYVDQSSSRGLEKFGEDIPTSAEVMRTNTLNFRPNFKFSRSKVFGGPDPHYGVRYEGLLDL